MSKQSLSWAACALSAACAVALTCTSDYNPFADAQNARVVVSTSSFAHGDSIPVFSTESLSVQVAVAEQMDSVVIRCLNNRYWQDTTVRDPQAATNYPFRFSLYDTGWDNVEIVGYRSDGVEVSTEYAVYGWSPLSQESISGELGSEFTLRTPTVRDDDVMYHWDFGNGFSVASAEPTMKTVIPTSSHSRRGLLRVSDLGTRYSSPATYFTHDLSDGLGPSIELANAVLKGDTILTADSTYLLGATIVDRGRGYVADAGVNRAPFHYATPPYYTYVFGRVDTISGLVRIEIRARDNFFNATIDTFFLRYDPSATRIAATHLAFLIPGADETTTQRRDYVISGTVEGTPGDTAAIRLHAMVNGKLHSESRVVSAGVRSEWYWQVNLDSARNDIVVFALDAGGDTLADTSVTILYREGGTDTIPPVLVDMMVDSSSGEVVHTERANAEIRVIAYDAGSGIAALSVNGDTLTPSGGYRWSTTLSLSHVLPPAGNRVMVLAADSAGNVVRDTITVYLNSIPLVVQEPVPPVPIIAGSVYRDSIVINDADKTDALEIEKKSGPPGLTVSAKGLIEWKTTAGDTGSHVITIGYRDPFRYETYSYSVWVVSEGSVPDTVQFATDEEDFPVYLEVGSDSARVVLDVVEGTGRPPYRFGAYYRSGGVPVAMNDSVFSWRPELTDTGRAEFVVTVNDTFGYGDTLYPSILVVPPNKECSLSVSHENDTTADGALDFSADQTPDTVHFRIYDTDDARAEEHRVQIFRSHTQTAETIDSVRDFSVVIDPAKVQGRAHDTIRVVVTDRVGHASTVEFRAYYQRPPYAPSNPSPVDGDTLRNTGVTFTWSGGDPDGNALTYAFHLSGAASKNVLGLTTEACHFEPPHAGRYQWSVVSSDGIDSTAGPTWTVDISIPGSVAFTTDTSDFPPTLIAGTESLSVALQLDTSKAKSPIQIAASLLDGGTEPTVDGGVLKWKPVVSDKGLRTLRIIAVDAYGEADTILPRIHVRYSKRIAKLRINTSSSGANVGDSVYNFPLLLRFRGSNFPFDSVAGDGSDVVFVKADGTALPHEIELWDSVNDSALVWVLVDTIYGNSSSQEIELRSAADGVNRSNGAAVFSPSNGFAGVWHLNENPANGTHAARDRTGNGNHGTFSPLIEADSGDLDPAMIGKGWDFRGYGEYVEIDAPATALKATDALTISCWAYPKELPDDWADVVARQYGTTYYDNYVVGFRSGNPAFHGVSGEGALESGSDAQTHRWYHLVFTKSGTSEKLYVNGQLKAERSASAALQTDDNKVTFAAQYNSKSTPTEFFRGVIDEVRISTTRRSAAWIRLSYLNQRSGTGFVSVQAQ